jgi:hypothetical protein
VESSAIGTVTHGLVLEITLSTLIANRAIKRVIGEQELRYTLSGLVNQRRIRLHHHSGLNGPGARGHRFWGSLDFDETHTT